MSELTHDATSRTLDTEQGTLHYHEAGDGPPLAAAPRVGPGRQRLGELPRQPAGVRRALPHARARHARLRQELLVRGQPADGCAAGRARLPRRDVGLDPIPIVGNSMGGNVAARIAANHPDRVSRLVTIGGVGVALFSPTPAEGIKLLVAVRRGSDPRATRGVDGVDGVRPGPSSPTSSSSCGGRRRTHPAALDDVRRMFNRKILDGDAPVAARRVGDQVGHARQDRGADADHVRPRRPRHAARQRARADAGRSRKCEVHIFPNCGHWAMIERKDEFESVVLSFLLRDRRPA